MSVAQTNVMRGARKTSYVIDETREVARTYDRSVRA